MEKKSANILEFKEMSQVVEDARSYIKDRRSGLRQSLKVTSPRVNDSFMDGFDWNRIVTVAGLSGAGKSTIVRQWMKEMIECNPNEKFDILSFQFEMLGLDEVARDVSSKLSKSVKKLYSADGKLSDEEIKAVDKVLDQLKGYPIYVVDNLGNVSEIKDTILYYITTKNLISEGRGLVVTIDHSMLVKPLEGHGEKDTLDLLMHTLVLLKKLISSIGGKIIFFVLSQLNRNIETTERITNPNLHYPNKNDLFGASSVYYSSDYVIVVHRPCLIEGLGNWYGPPRKNWPQGLPVYSTEDATRPLIYLHIIKERFGTNRILPMLDDLENSRLLEYNLG